MNTVVITGVSQGLGRVTAEMFAEKGWHVVGTGRSERPNDLSSSIHYHQFNAADADACASFWEEIAKDHNDTYLINNAGSYAYGNVADTASAAFQNQMASNYFASVYMTQGLLKFVPKAKIINVISAGALEAHASQSAYGASKAAIMHFFQSLRKEVSAKDYQITNIYPGDIATHGVDENVINPTDLALFIVEQAELKNSLYIPEVTIHPSNMSA